MVEAFSAPLPDYPDCGVWLEVPPGCWTPPSDSRPGSSRSRGEPYASRPTSETEKDTKIATVRHFLTTCCMNVTFLITAPVGIRLFSGSPRRRSSLRVRRAAGQRQNRRGAGNSVARFVPRVTQSAELEASSSDRVALRNNKIHQNCVDSRRPSDRLQRSPFKLFEPTAAAQNLRKPKLCSDASNSSGDKPDNGLFENSGAANRINLSEIGGRTSPRSV
jgi:hypothetical protein